MARKSRERFVFHFHERIDDQRNTLRLEFLPERPILRRHHHDEHPVPLAPSRRVKKHHRRAGEREVM